MRSRTILFALISAVSLWPKHSFAVDASASSDQLQEIVVTAQKRVEDVQRVPISVSVFNNASFDRLSIQDLADVANMTPGVDYLQTGPKNLLSIRGIFSGAGAATTAVYIDDVPVQVRVGIVGLIGATLPQVFDLDRVEVLRGPQGTLFGSSAEGGAIRFITPEPSLTQYSGYSRADLGYTDDGAPSYEAGAAFGGPIVSDELGFRVSVWHRTEGGYVNHISAIPGGYDDANSNWGDSDVLRAALALAPNESLRITPSLYYQHLYSHDSSGFEPAESPQSQDPFVQQWGVLNPHYSNIGDGRFVNPQLEQTPSTDTFYLPALKAELDLAGMQLISNTGYLHRSNTTNEDFTTATPEAFGLPWPLVAAAADHNIINTDQNVVTEDLRIQSAGSDRPLLEWTLGLSFVDARQRSYNPEYSPYLPTLVPGTVLLPGNLSYIGDERSIDRQLAFYGQATYHITHQWSVTAGARVARDSDDYSIYQTGPFAGGTSYATGEQGQTVKDPKIGVNFQVNDDNLIYLSAAKGDRVGGVNAPFPLTGSCLSLLNQIGLNGIPPTFQGDSLWSYEIGSKNRLANGTFVLQASAFHIDWSNVQQAVSLPPNLCSETFTSNLGKARSNGADLQATARIGSALELGLAVGYTNAKDSQTLGPGITQYVTAGQQINQYATPWTVVPSAQYSFTVAQRYQAYIRVDDEFHSKNPGPFAQQFPNNVAVDPNFIANPSTNVLNVHVGAIWNGWDVSLYALNVLNSHPLLYNTALESAQFVGPTYTIRPLTAGVRATYRW
ncbi:MAG: TonB-dependent receptor [Steroidobacteraceae bacterium]|jgi:outer membrane receptor protein involved in Fe transport